MGSKRTTLNRILIIGNYGAGNLGDDAILAGIVTELRLVGFKGKIEVTHGGFQSSTDIYKGLKKVPFVPFGFRSRLKRGQKKAAHAAIKRADLVILGGGGLFVDTETIKAPLIWAKQAKTCRKLKTPYICYGQSIGPLKHFISRFVTKRVFKNAKAIHVRDNASARTLRKMRITEVTIGSDPSLSWLQSQKTSIKRNNALVISLRHWTKSTSKLWAPLLTEIKKFAKKKKLKPVLIAMDIRNQKEIKNLKKTGLEVFEPASATSAFEGIQKSKMAITMRLHACIFALAAKTPLIAISYSPKVESLIKSLGSSAQLIKATNFSTRKLKKSLQKAKREALDLETPAAKNQAFLSHNIRL
jgi:polysaccharide pyruvyl transferase CsaB